MKIKVAGIGSIMLFLTSCFQEDIPVPPYESPVGVERVEIPMGSTYEFQLFYRMSDRQVVKTVSRNSWDLAFESGNGGWKILLNTARFVRAADLGAVDFESVTALPSGSELRADAPGWHPDSLQFSSWGVPEGNQVVSKGHTYIVDLGINLEGGPMGRRKVKILGLENNQYRIAWANLDNSGYREYSLARRPGVNYVYLNLRTPENPEVFAEPDSRESWDLQFTNYTANVLNTATGQDEEYLVVGVLLNPYAVRAARAFNHDFENIHFDELSQFTFTARRDIIGYDWKAFSIDGGSWTIFPEMVYLIRDVKGLYYRIRFIGFLNAMGQRGFPAFEQGQF
jgi:hypothetical protein